VFASITQARWSERDPGTNPLSFVQDTASGEISRCVGTHIGSRSKFSAALLRDSLRFQIFVAFYECIQNSARRRTAVRWRVTECGRVLLPRSFIELQQVASLSRDTGSTPVRNANITILCWTSHSKTKTSTILTSACCGLSGKRRLVSTALLFSRGSLDQRLYAPKISY